MVQELIAYLIIAIAFFTGILYILRFFKLAGKKTAGSSTCGTCSTGCEMKQLHLHKGNKSVKQELYKYYL